MIQLKNRGQLGAAIERARRDAKNLLVQVTPAARQYRVLNRRTGNVYTVNFVVHRDGKRFGFCTCEASEFNLPCKHIAAAAALNICLAEQGLLNGPTAKAA